MKFCTQCGVQLSLAQKFCTSCGAPNASFVEQAPTEPPYVPEPTPAPEPEPVPEPTLAKPPVEYRSASQIIYALGKANLVADVLDAPESLAPEAQAAWNNDELGAVICESNGSKYQIVFAKAELSPSSFHELTRFTHSSAMNGDWTIYVYLLEGDQQGTASILETVFNTLG